ncbi:MAG: hypothetical protein OXC19_00935 [Bryobacterales bacterium]|nr:hypothetical protein [Bryobacterales bacterium]
MTTNDRAVERHPDGSATCHTYFEPTEEVMRELVRDLFVGNWERIVVGPCVEGAVFEVRFQEEPDLRISDGYLTVDLGAWHFHLCIGRHEGSPAAELREKRPVARISLWERRSQETVHGRSWGVRMWNGYGDQMTTVFLPSPWLTDEMQFLERPDWSRLDLYYRLREKYLGEDLPSDFKEAAAAPMGTCQ